LLQRDSVDLVRSLGDHGYTTVIETGGSLDVRPYLPLPRVILSVDVKCPSSNMEKHNRWENLPLLRPTDVEKFVIQDRRDYLYAKRTLKSHPSKAEVLFQPVWGSDAGRLADWVLQDRLDVRTMLQEHKVLWGDVPGR
jgi:7-carboxy-7-deazaguanine synthase